MLRLGVLRVFCVVLCVGFCTDHFVMVPLNLTYLHCLQHYFFEHLFNLYYSHNLSIVHELEATFAETRTQQGQAQKPTHRTTQNT